MSDTSIPFSDDSSFHEEVEVFSGTRARLAWHARADEDEHANATTGAHQGYQWQQNIARIHDLRPALYVISSPITAESLSILVRKLLGIITYFSEKDPDGLSSIIRALIHIDHRAMISTG